MRSRDRRRRPASPPDSRRSATRRLRHGLVALLILSLPLFAPSVAAQTPTANDDGSYTVPADWALIPSGVSAGDKFRLLFITSTNTSVGHALGDNIAAVNTFVQGRAAAGHAAIRPYSAAFRVVGSTASVDARDNTATTYTSDDKGPPIYWLSGVKLADDYEDFYDGSWESYAQKDESGTDLNEHTIATGSESNGVKDAGGFVLGNSGNLVRSGNPRSGPPLDRSAFAGVPDQVYALSPVFVVAAAPTDGVTVTPTALALTELHATDAEGSYTVVLATDPGADVTVTAALPVANAADAEIKAGAGVFGGSATLTFTHGSSGTWSTAQTLTVRAKNDGDVTGETFSITHAAAVSDTTNPYHQITIDPVAVTLTDAGHGVVVEAETASLAANGMASYGVRLKSDPGGTVVITPTSGTPEAATVSGALSFDSTDWGTAKEVTLTGAGEGATTVTHAVTTATTDYPLTLTIASVAATVTADTRPQINLSFTNSEVDEGDNLQQLRATLTGADGTTTYSITTAALDLAVSGVDAADWSWRESKTTWIFAPVTSPPYRTTRGLNATDDAADEPNETLTIGFGENFTSTTLRPGSTASILIIDKDPTTVTLGGGGTVREDGSDAATVTVTLSRRLYAGETVTVPLAVSGMGVAATDYAIALAAGEGVNDGVALDADAPHSAAQPALVFTGHGSDEVRVATLTVTGAQDTADEGASEAVAFGFGTGSRAVTSNLDRASGTGTGGTTTAGAATVTVTDDDTAANSAPTFGGNATQTRSVAENAASGTAVGAPVTAATDADNDSLTYAMGGTDAGSFSFNATTRQISVSSPLDHEGKGSYEVTVTASDSNGGSAVATVTITVTDVNEPPAAPAAPLVRATSGTTTSLDVSWTAPANAGRPAIENYDLQYRTGSDSWGNGPQDVAATSTAITGLSAGTAYDVRVRAGNDEGEGDWSPAGSGSTPAWTVAVSPASIAEDGGSSTVTVSSGGALFATSQTITLTLAGTATQTDDYAIGSESLTLAAGQTAVTTTVTGVDDSIDEVNETVTVSADVGGQATLTITDDDTAGVTISETTRTVAENGGTDTYTVKLNSKPGDSVTIRVSSAAGAEVDGPDAGTAYTATEDLTFSTSNWNTPQTVTVRGQDDDIDNPSNRRTVAISHAVTEAGADGYPTGLVIAGVTVTVTDDDTAGVTIAQSGGSTAVLEDGSNTDSYTVRLDSKPRDSVTIRVSSAAGAEVDGPDAGTSYAATEDLTFSPTNWNSAQTVTVRGQDDDIDNANDRRTVAITHAVTEAGADGYPTDLSIAGVSVRVNDDDTAGVTVSQATRTVAEAGGTASYTVVLDSEPAASVVITVTSATPGAALLDGPDAGTAYAATEALTFSTSSWNSPQTVTIQGQNDDVDNPANSRSSAITHAVTTAAGHGYPTGLAITGVTASVTDDDAAPGGVALSVSDDAVAEGDGATPVTVTATVRGTTRYALDTVVTVAVAGSGGTNVVPFTAIAPFTITIPAGAASHSGMFTLTPTDDASDQHDETVTVSGTAPADVHGAAVSVTAAEIALADDDPTTVTLSAPPGDVAEAGGTKDVTLTLSRALSGSETITVPLSVAGATVTSDYGFALEPALQAGVTLLTGGSHSAQHPAVRFAAGASAALLRFSAVDNAVRTQPWIVIGYGAAHSAGGGIAVATPAGGPVRFAVTDDETGDIVVPLGWSLKPAESAAGGTFRLVFTTSGTRAADSGDIADYDAFIRDQLVAGHAAIVPFAGFFKVAGSTAGTSAASHNGFSGAASIPIYWLGGLSGGERVAQNYPAFRGEWTNQATPRDQSGAVVSVSADGYFTGSDSAGASASHPLGPGATRLGFLNDGASGRAPLGSGSDTATGAATRSFYGLSPVFTVAQHPIISVTPGAGVTEGEAAEFTIKADPAPVADLSVSLFVTADSGFVDAGTGARTFTVPASAGSATFSVQTIGDGLDEPDGEVRVVVRSGANYGTGDPGVATVAVADDDRTALMLSFGSGIDAGNPVLAEGASGQLRLRAGRQLAAGESLTATLSFGGTATRGADYTLACAGAAVSCSNLDAGTATVTLGGGARVATLTLSAAADADHPESETVDIGIASVANMGLSGGTDTPTDNAGAVTITSLAPPAVVASFGSAAYTATEAPASRSVDVTVTLSPAPAAPITLSYGIAGSASAGADYTTLSGSVDAAANAVTVTIPVTIIDDAADDDAETIILTLSASASYTLGAIPQATITITDDDGPPNNAPTFGSDATQARSVAEDAASGTAVGAPVTAATDADNDSLTYAMGGTDAASFSFNASTRQISTAAALDHESKSSYTVTVTASDPNGGSALATVTITVTDVNEPPVAPAAPAVTATSGSTTSLDVSWSAPANAGRPAITNYDLRYRSGGGAWSNGPQDVAATSTAITGLSAGTAYQVQVRATNDEGDGQWSPAGSGTTAASATDPVLTVTGGSAVTEGGAASFTINASPAASGSLTVMYTVTQDGMFVASGQLGPQTLTLSGASHSFTIPTVGDSNDEPDGSVTVTLNTGTGYTVGTQNAASVTVNDDDDPPVTPDPIAVIEGWALIPSGLAVGAEFRLLFMTSTRRDATATDIATYDTFVQARAAAGHTDIQPYSAQFKVLGSTATVDARDHTMTDPDNAAHPDAPIYWLNGVRLANNNAKLWSARWEDWEEQHRKTEAGTTGDSDWQWTGTDEDGTAHANHLGNSPNVRRGRFKAGGDVPNPISHVDTPRAESHSLYAISPVFRVLSATPELTITGGNAVTEGEAASFTITASVAPASEITFRYTVTQDGMFLSAGQLGAAERTLSGASRSFTIVTVDDDADESDGSVTVTLETGTGYTLGSPAAATVRVADDDDGGGGPIRPVGPVGPIGGGGGGGGPSGPVPSEEEFAWNVSGDLEALDPAHGHPTGAFSDGTTLWLAENGAGADDAVHAYDLASGERVEEREFTLDGLNRAPRGVASDGEVVWVADSGRDRLFAYDAASGERLAGRDIALARGNRDARGLWTGGETLWVLNRNPSLYAYHPQSGDLLGVYELDGANGDPRGIWSDGVSAWVSDHGAKRVFAYRLPALATGETGEDGAGEDAAAEEAGAEPVALERERALEFGALTKAGNNSPRGIWSDGALLYVADAHDGRVYSYNMPAAIDARLASLTLDGVALGAFSALRTEYEGVAETTLAATTVEAEAARPGASVRIEPADSDPAAPGHQAAFAPGDTISVTVGSEDGTRTRVYRVSRPQPPAPPAPRLSGDIAAGFSLTVFAGGSLAQLADAAERRHITALYILDEGRWLLYSPLAPDFVNAAFAQRFENGVPQGTVFVAASDGPATEDAGPAPAPREWPRCLAGEVAAGFSLVRFAGGSLEALADCAGRSGVAALWTLAEGEWLLYAPGAPDFVNAAFAQRFPGGIPAGEPLAVRADGEAETEGR